MIVHHIVVCDACYATACYATSPTHHSRRFMRCIFITWNQTNRVVPNRVVSIGPVYPFKAKMIRLFVDLLWYVPCILNISGAGFATICKSVFFDTTPFDTTRFIYLRTMRCEVERIQAARGNRQHNTPVHAAILAAPNPRWDRAVGAAGSLARSRHPQHSNEVQHPDPCGQGGGEPPTPADWGGGLPCRAHHRTSRRTTIDGFQTGSGQTFFLQKCHKLP